MLSERRDSERIHEVEFHRLYKASLTSSQYDRFKFIRFNFSWALLNQLFEHHPVVIPQVLDVSHQNRLLILLPNVLEVEFVPCAKSVLQTAHEASVLAHDGG